MRARRHRGAAGLRRAAAAVAAVAAVALLGAPGAAAERDEAGYRLATAPYAYRFPRDHGAHPEFRTEWWYYTGHLESAGRRFGYELTFFRVGVSRELASSPSAWAPHTLLFAHAALTDEAAGRHRFDERIARPALGMAGADTATLRVWVEDWSAALASDGRTHRLRAEADGFALALDLEPVKPPVIHGADGVSRKGPALGQASHYVSLTRLATRGTITVDGDTRPVTGSSWMDHEFMSGALDPDLAGWDWASVQLDDGRELMLYVLRRRDGRVAAHSSGTLVARDGRARTLDRDAFALEPTGTWTSPHTGATYPSGWRVAVPSAALELTLEPTVRDQEMRTTATAGLSYWEGSVVARGTAGGRAVAGRGYVELTGYAGGPPGP